MICICYWNFILNICFRAGSKS